MNKFNLEDVLHIHHKLNHGIVLTGRMLEGEVSIGDILILPDGNKVKVIKIEEFKKSFNIKGDNVSLYVGEMFTREYFNTFRRTILDVISLEELRNSKIDQLGIK